MKKNLVIIFLLCSLFSQAQFLEAPPKMYNRSLNSTALVVLKYSDSLNTKIKNSFQKYWTATPYQFVTEKGVDSLTKVKSKPQYTVFDGSLVKTVHNITDEGGLKRQKGSFGNWWSFFLFPLDKDNNPDSESVVAWGPINFWYFEWSKEYPYEKTIYRMDFIVKQMNDVLEFIKKDLKADPVDYEKMVNQKTIALKEKTLLVPQELLEEYDVRKAQVAQMEAGVGKVYTSRKPVLMALLDMEVMKEYKGKFKVLPFHEINIIANSAEASQYALFSPLFTDRIYIFIFDLATKEVIHTDKGGIMHFRVNSKFISQINKQAAF